MLAGKQEAAVGQGKQRHRRELGAFMRLWFFVVLPVNCAVLAKCHRTEGFLCFCFFYLCSLIVTWLINFRFISYCVFSLISFFYFEWIENNFWWTVQLVLLLESRFEKKKCGSIWAHAWLKCLMLCMLSQLFMQNRCVWPWWRGITTGSVSYTHLTLPTTAEV